MTILDFKEQRELRRRAEWDGVAPDGLEWELGARPIVPVTPKGS